jgi:hypothetical protein
LEQEETLRSITNRIQLELNDDKHRIERLRGALDESQNSRQDLWEWAITISNSFALDGYRDLVTSGIRNDAWREIDVSLYLAYSMMSGLQNRVKEAKAAHSFYLGYRGDDKSANQGLVFVRSLAREAFGRVEEAILELERFRRYKGYIKTESTPESTPQNKSRCKKVRPK